MTKPLTLPECRARCAGTPQPANTPRALYSRTDEEVAQAMYAIFGPPRDVFGYWKRAGETR